MTQRSTQADASSTCDHSKMQQAIGITEGSPTGPCNPKNMEYNFLTRSEAEGKKIIFRIFWVAEDNINGKLHKGNLEFAKLPKRS